MKKQLFPFFYSALLIFSAQTYSGRAATNVDLNVRFDFTSHEQVDSTNGSRIVIRRISTSDIIYGLALDLNLPTTNLWRAKLVLRVNSQDSSDSAFILKLANSENDVSQSFEITWPDNPDYHAAVGDVRTRFGRKQETDRIMRMVSTSGSPFDVQGFSTYTVTTNSGSVYTSLVGKVAGGGTIRGRNGVARDGVLEGTITISRPISVSPWPRPIVTTSGSGTSTRR